MKSRLTAKFMAYAKKPKSEVIRLEGKAEWTNHYPIEGFLTNDESSWDRMGRLVEALAAGKHLSKANKAYLHSNRSTFCRDYTNQWRLKGGYINKKQVQRHARANAYYIHATKPLVGGFR